MLCSSGGSYTWFWFLQVWQHYDCMRLETEVEHYLCEQCDLRPVDRVCVLQTFRLALLVLLGGINHRANHPFNLTALFFGSRRFR